MLADEETQGIIDHIARHVGEPEDVLHELIPQDLHIDIHIVAPTSERNFYTLLTMGMSERPMMVDEGCEGLEYAELMVCLPPSWPLEDQEDERHGWPITWLNLLARMPHDHDTFLAEGHTIPNGDPPEPFAEGTRLCGMLIRHPLSSPAAFRTLTLKEKTIHFYGLVPLYADEMAYKVNQGFAQLAALLDAHGVTELLTVNRRNVLSGEGLRD